jgi:hypothetical protein
VIYKVVWEGGIQNMIIPDDGSAAKGQGNSGTRRTGTSGVANRAAGQGDDGGGRGRGRMNSTGNTPTGVLSAQTGTPYMPATPFASPLGLSGWLEGRGRKDE